MDAMAKDRRSDRGNILLQRINLLSSAPQQRQMSLAAQRSCS
jgi:hypothetical protein